MRRVVVAALMAAAVAPVSFAAPVVAQSRADEARMDAAQARFDREYQIYQDEVQRYRSSRAGGYDRGTYRRAPGDYDVPPPGDDRDEGSYDPSRYYRSSGDYQTRTLSADDRVYRGTDGRYYCKRSDGTTGLILGAAGGGILGNVIDGGHSRTAGTLIGGALGALAGKSIQQNSSIQCR